MPRRPFGLIDLHIAIAATAMGFGVARWNYEVLVVRMNRAIFPGTSWQAVVAYVTLFSPILLFWSLGMVVIRWRGPASPRRRLFSEPGFVASVGAWIGLGIYIVASSLMLASWGPRRYRDPWTMMPNLVGMSVIACWAVLWLRGRWCPSPDWVDRTGRWLGYAWIVVFALAWLRFN